MNIDLEALARASLGDPDAKLTVRRAWLREVHAALVQAKKDSAELQRLRDLRKIGDGLGNIAEMLGKGVRRR